MKTTINIDTFEDTYRTPLLFSLFEGLKPGEGFQIMSKQSIEDLKTQFIGASLHNLKLEQAGQSGCVNVYKVHDSDVGCCGMCGG